ncbi:nSTAND1 domain-containing NTPase [Nocardia sp. NBC_01327]|uniref:nSTAND1 domain-containing NTPase n=1 Tax=Nocardia sp. NBC_01327 TaxID=2903593 RepID=UPI002E13FDE7|nr:hypothetical protein OG326_14980 [Nocardia sp. NBC_01327]
MTDGVELFPIAIGEFDAEGYERIDGMEANLAAIIDTFSDFECHVVEWPRTAAPCCGCHPAGPHLDCSVCPDRKGDHYRGHDDVHDRLREWEDRDPATRSILYWVGHGSSDEQHPTLIHSRTSPKHPATEGIGPERIADAIMSRFESRPRPWVIVMIEACQSARFVSQLQNALNDRSYRGSYLLISPIVGEGAVTLGRWQAVLHNILHKTFATEDVLLDRFAKALHSRDVTVKQSGPIADDVVALVRRIRLPANISVDAREELAQAIHSLPLDVQRHFITKAHGGLGSFEHVVLNEQSWYFEGREEATRHVVSWLQEHRSGMLVITGPPGSGKSAFLGNLIVHADPALRTALQRAGLLAESPNTVPDNVFDTCLSLIGAPTMDVVTKLAAAVDATIPDEVVGRDAAAAGRWLARTIRARGTPLTIVADALDEAVFPEELATYVLGLLGRIPAVRVLVGTRQSTQDQIDIPTTDTNLLRALGASELDLVPIRSDHQAVRRFVAHRLRNRVGMDVDRFADAVAQRNTHFLIAQLAVHEVLSDPQWRSDNAWDDLLARNHRGIFSLAVDRLAQKHPSYPGLLISLAVSAGHGLPIHDGIWRKIAQAVATVDNSQSIDDHHIERFIDDAAPYVIVDNEHQQTVYRLAHRTFAEYFTHGYHTEHRHFFATEISESAITTALITAADETLAATGADGTPTVINPYIRHYLSTHAANSGPQGWYPLNDEKLLALLDPEQVGADAERAAFGRVVLPPMVDGIANAREWLRRTDRQHYGFALRIAVARTTGFHAKTGPADPNAIADLCWAAVQRRMSFRTLIGHTDSVVTFAAVPAPDGGTWLASASRDGTIRLWNPTTGQPLGVLSGHNGAVTALAVADEHGSILASVGEDHQLLLWDLRSKQPLATLTDTVDGVALAAIPVAGNRFLLACSSGDAIQIWDPATNRLIGVLLAHLGGVTALAVLIDPDYRSLLISVGSDSTIRVWDAIDGRQISMIPSPTAPVTQVAALKYDGKYLLAAVADGRMTLLNLSGIDSWRPTQSHGIPITSMAVMSLGNWGLLVAGAGSGRICLWDVSSVLFEQLSPGVREGFSLGNEWDWKRPTTEPVSTLAGQIADTSDIMALATIPLPDRGALLASAHYATIRLWNPTAGLWNSVVEQDSPGVRPTEHRGAVTALAAVPSPSHESVLASVGHDRPIALHHADSGESLGFLGTFTNRTNAVTALATVPSRDGGTMLATASDGGRISLWNCVSGQGPSTILPSHGSEVTAMTAMTIDGTTLLASAGRDGVICLWDSTAGQRPPIATLSDHGPTITALVSIPGTSRGTLLASADADGNIRIFDPTNPSGKELLGTFSGGTAEVRALTVVSDTRSPLLVSASQDGTIHIFDPSSPAAPHPISTMHGHKGAVTALTTWSPTFFVSGGRDSMVRLWNLAETTPQHAIPVDAPINTMVALPGEQLAVALDDGLLVLRINAISRAQR